MTFRRIVAHDGPNASTNTASGIQLGITDMTVNLKSAMLNGTALSTLPESVMGDSNQTKPGQSSETSSGNSAKQLASEPVAVVEDSEGKKHYGIKADMGKYTSPLSLKPKA